MSYGTYANGKYATCVPPRFQGGEGPSESVVRHRSLLGPIWRCGAEALLRAKRGQDLITVDRFACLPYGG